MVHASAFDGFARGVDAYRSSRPNYQRDVTAMLIAEYGTGSVADVGAGTGILTRVLAEAGVDVVAIEPVEEMRQALAEGLPDVRVLEGSAEDLPLDDHSIGMIAAAQAAHWFRYPQALDEITRVLVPRGHLATIWNVRDETVPWARAYTEAIAEFEGDTPRHRTLVWRRAIDADPRFSLVEEASAPNPQATTPDRVVARALSTSFIAILPPNDQARLEATLREIVAPLGPEFDFPYRTELQVWRLLA